jgi:serine/threonine-protein kinase
MTTPRDLFGLVGKVLADKFRVDQVLGEGGYGVVYAGTHLLLGVPVAIKCLKPTSFTPEEQKRTAEAFLSEARILFGLSHPAIVRLYDAGITHDTGVPYVVLERLTGITIADEITARAAQKKPFDKDELAAIFGPVLEGVGFAHERGIVHRDLKPSNMMLVTAGGKTTPKVLDFGTAHATEAAREKDIATATTTHAPAASFTPLYAAPEQWDRSLGTFSARTDVFALGLTIAEACLLAYPLDTKLGLVSVVKAVLDDRSRPLVSEARPDLPIELERVIHRALRTRPSERYPDAREMLASFRAALRVTTTTAPLARPVASRQSVPSARPPVSTGPPPSPVFLQAHSTTTQPQTYPPPMQAVPLQRPSSSLPWFIAILAVIVAGGAVAGLGALAFTGKDRNEETERVTPPPQPSASASAHENKEDEDEDRDTPAPKRDAAGPPHIALTSTFSSTRPASEVIPIWNAHQAELDRCIATVNARGHSAEGMLSLSLLLGKDGRPSSASCGGEGLEAYCSCLQGVVTKWTFPVGSADQGPGMVIFVGHVMAGAQP